MRVAVVGARAPSCALAHKRSLDVVAFPAVRPGWVMAPQDQHRRPMIVWGLILLLTAGWLIGRLAGSIPDPGIGLWDWLAFVFLSLSPFVLMGHWSTRGELVITDEWIERSRPGSTHRFHHHRLGHLRRWMGFLIARYDDGTRLVVQPKACPAARHALEHVYGIRSARARRGRWQYLPLDRLVLGDNEDLCDGCQRRPASKEFELQARRGVDLLFASLAVVRSKPIAVCRRCHWWLVWAYWLGVLLLLTWMTAAFTASANGFLLEWSGGMLLLIGLGALALFWLFWERFTYLLCLGTIPVWLGADGLCAWFWFPSVRRSRKVAAASVGSVVSEFDRRRFPEAVSAPSLEDAQIEL